MTLPSLASFRTSVGVPCAMLTLTALGCSGPAPAADGSGGAEASSGGVDSGGSGGSGDQGGGSSSGGASNATGGAASGGTGGSDPEESTTIGRIQVYRTLAFDDTSPGRVTALFDYAEQAAWDAFETAERTCTSEPFGSCRLTTCDPLSVVPNPGDEPSPVRLEAGTITLTPDRDDFTATGMPGADNEYTFTASGTVLGEEIMTVTASGGSIGAFQGMVQIPLAPFLLSHDASALEAGTVVSIPAARTEDLALSWDARGTAEKLQTIVRYPSGASPVTLSCSFDATPGSGSILGAALSQLPPGTEIHFFAVNSEMVTTPQGDVELLAVMEMLSPDRTGYPMFVLE